ncbi:fumarylacetoacetate hydrolase family protein [Endozoicomonas sp.]|nr:fumarylacetoacetate hydrolase family protein [Endozoicomonas sp.]
MKYRHRWANGDRINLPAGKAVCVGRNYAEHIYELNNSLPEDPVLFIKPNTALCHAENAINLPQNKGAVHHELEITLLIDSVLTNANETEAVESIKALGLGIDLTLRDLQSIQKEKGLPWEIAKAFDHSCPLSGFVAKEYFGNLSSIEICLEVNGKIRQKSSSASMLTSIPDLLSYISRHFTLMPGDVVLTGTPAGVGPLTAGDTLAFTMDKLLSVNTQCISS